VETGGESNRIVGHMKLTQCIVAVFLAVISIGSALEVPTGFKALFNGKDLDGWRGGTTHDYRLLMAMPEGEREAQIAKWTATMTEPGATGKPHWTVENEELLNDGFGDYATTKEIYGDFELRLDYKTVAKADSGVYLRGVPQVQIWDSTGNDEESIKLGRHLGSGGLWNNSPGAAGKDPLVKADKPFGEWNHLRVVMIGSRVSVWLNDQLVVDHAMMENYYDRKVPIPVRGPIQLQTHGGEIRWKNIFLKELSAEEANEILSTHGDEDFKPVWNGKDFEGWAGAVESYEIVADSIRCKTGAGGTVYWNKELGDFSARLKFKTPEGGNNGLAIRYPGTGNTAYVGMTELQVLDDDAKKYQGLDARQFTGSAYGMVAAHRGYTRPAGEWNFQEVAVKGSVIQVELNGTRILDADLSKVDLGAVMDQTPHPGKDRQTGFFGFAGHSDPVEFRDVRIKE